MRCKKHISDRSSVVGVCATCLRERLFALIAAQALADEATTTTTTSHRKSDATHPPPLPPLIFPRSVSPYICRRSDDSSWNQHNHNDRRFYSTPQIGPTSTFIADSTITGRNKKKKQSKFSLFSNLFKSSTKSSNPLEPDPKASTVSRASLSTTTTTSTSSPISSTWFSSIISGGRRKKQSRLFSHEDSVPTTTTNRRPCRDRGMSPSCEDEDDGGSPPSASGYSSESSNRKVQTTPAQPTRRKGHHQRNVSGMAFCLSPLVRASPHRNQKDVPPGGIGVSGEIGGGGGRVSSSSSSNKPHLSTAASFCANRSRKLANFGRSYNYNP